MPGTADSVAYCHACGAPMDVSAVAPFTNVECPQCGKHTRVKREFGPYTLVRRHAIGGMSMVFVAHDNTLNREVALKILSEDFSADERRIAAFEQEARLTASLSHPNVVRVLTTGRAFGRFYIAMEFVPGGHFEHQIRERGKIPESELLPIAIEVAQGLKAAHGAGLIHRDVKPGNILLDADGHAKLVDFGLALVTQGGKAQAKELWATPYYVPPETVEGHAEDFRSDIYAFGATLYHALAGKPPCDEESMATDLLREAKKRVIPLATTEPSISEETCHIVDKAMAYSPDARFSSYDDLISSLAVALSHLKSGRTNHHPNATQRRALKKRKERQIVAAAAVTTLVMAAAVIGWFTREKPAPAPPRDTPVAAPAAPAAPETDDSSAAILSEYRAARSALESRNHPEAANHFAALFRNSKVHEPSRSMAGVEAVLATLLDGRTGDARLLARDLGNHLRSLPSASPQPAAGLLAAIDGMASLRPLAVPKDPASQDPAQQVLAAMLAGLKNWEQGLLDAAVPCFQAATAPALGQDAQWAAIYQQRAADYLADHQVLSGPVFQQVPATHETCQTALAALDQAESTLKTRGRARFNIRAWRLDLTRQAKRLLATPPQTAGQGATSANAPGTATIPPLAEVLAQLDNFTREFRFSEAATYLKSLPGNPEGASREALLSITESAATFIADLEDDLSREPVSASLQLRNGQSITRIALDAEGAISVNDRQGRTRSCQWSDLPPDALIALHRQLVSNPANELERLRRHECAIAFDWLAGNRERALNAARTLSQSSPTFKQRWDHLASGLPK